MALFKSYAVFYLTIGTAIHDVLPVFYSYPHDVTETVTFVLKAVVVYICSVQCLEDPVSIK